MTLSRSRRSRPRHIESFLDVVEASYAIQNMQMCLFFHLCAHTSLWLLGAGLRQRRYFDCCSSNNKWKRLLLFFDDKTNLLFTKLVSALFSIQSEAFHRHHPCSCNGLCAQGGTPSFWAYSAETQLNNCS